jgi:glycosyltransferase involved in cell wall biosynthesis
MTELSRPAMLREKVRAAQFVVAISEHGRRYLTSLAPDRHDRICLVRNGIDVAAFAPPSTAAPVRTRAPRVLTVARLVPKKGIDVLIETCRVLRDAGTDLPCDVVGGGPLEQQLWEQAAAAGVADLVRFHGSLAQPAIAQLMTRAAVFVLPCRIDSAGDQDGLPVSIVEAMAAGLPVISTPIAGVPEVVDDGVNGRLIPADDAPALAASLRELLSSEPRRARLSKGARRTAASYDRRIWVSVLKDLFSYGPGVSGTPGSASPWGQAEVLVGDRR